MYLILLLFSFGTANLLEQPSNAMAIVGKTIRLKCRTAPEKWVEWRVYRHGASSSEPIVQGHGSISQDFRETKRFECVKMINGQQDLIIRNVTFGDAGQYVCWDDMGAATGAKAFSYVVIINDRLKCSTARIYTTDICDLNNRDSIQMSCDLKFSGISPPLLMWFKDSNFTFQSKNAERNLVTSNLTIQLERNQKSIYSCRVNAAGIFYSFPVPDYLNHEYVNTTRKLPVFESCFAETNLNCSYTWIRDPEDGKPSITILGNNLSIPHLDKSWEGIYRCNIECQMKEQKCIIQRLVVRVYNDTIQQNDTFQHEQNTFQRENILTYRYEFGGIFSMLVIILILIVHSQYFSKIKRNFILRKNALI